MKQDTIKGMKWSLGTSEKGNYSITIEELHGYRPICTLTDDTKLLSKEQIRLAGIKICTAVNNFEEMAKALQGFVDEFEQTKRAQKQLSGEDIEEPENITNAKQVLKNAGL